MKKILTILTIMMMAVVGKASADDIVWTEVSTATEFINAVKTKDASGNYTTNVKLTANIDLSGQSFSGGTVFTDIKFQGKITGENPGGTDFYIKGTGTYNGCMLFSEVDNATFTHLILTNFIFDYDNRAEKRAVLTARSNNSIFQYITIKNCNIYGNVGYSVDEIGGLIAISKGDNITYCNTESSCKFEGSTFTAADVNVGGIVGKAYNTVFTFCHNAANIYSEDNQSGGIVAYAEGCTIDRCLNSGEVDGVQNTGGIVGNARKATVIERCVNLALVDYKGGGNIKRIGGIAGLLQDNGSCIVQCLNFGDVNSANKYGEILGGREDGATEWNNAASLCFYYCQYNGSHKDNESTFSGNALYRHSKMLSGEFACKSTIGEVAGADTWLYQDLDGKDFCTYYPVPIPSAGVVYSNILCDGTQSYSNTFHSTAAHDPVYQGDYCSVCGKMKDSKDVTSIAHVTDASQLVSIANLVNDGKDFSNTTVYLDNDIDLASVSFPMIGNSSTHPYMGVFNGLGHRIKNMSLSFTQSAVGFFGAVAGTSTIKNVIIDSSCSITSGDGSGVAGLIGGIYPYNSTASNVTIKNCGNEAPVTGVQNAGGILGGVYSSDNNVVTITNCYNTGAITGSIANQSAALCGYARMNYTITNCYNSGSVSGVSDDQHFFRIKDGGTTSVNSCYDIAGTQSGVTLIKNSDIYTGNLCKNLNANRGDLWAWTQDLGESNSYPTFGTTGVRYSRTMANQWGTICLPFAAAMSDDYDFYELSSVTDDQLTLKKITTETLPAGTPAIIRRSGSAATDIVILASGTDFKTTPETGSPAGGLTLTGAFTDTEITDKDGYIIANNAFWNIADIKGENKVYCSPFRAWLAGSLSNGAKQLNLGIGDVTGIYNLDADVNADANLNGKFLINGRLVIIKDGKEYNAAGQQVR